MKWKWCRCDFKTAIHVPHASSFFFFFFLFNNLRCSQRNSKIIRRKWLFFSFFLMKQIWDELMTSLEEGGKQLVDAEVIKLADLNEWVKMRGRKGGIIGLGLPSYCLLDTLVESIQAGSSGIVLSNGGEVNHQNRPQDRLLDWFFHPVMVLKEQIRVINLQPGELRFLEKLVVFGNNAQRMDSWNNGSVAPQDALRNAQIQAISRRYARLCYFLIDFPFSPSARNKWWFPKMAQDCSWVNHRGEQFSLRPHFLQHRAKSHRIHSKTGAWFFLRFYHH